MKVILFGDNKKIGEELVTKFGFDVVDSNPEAVISFGGDGTLMKAEFAYPGIPKIVLRDSNICKVCSVLTNEEVLEKISRKEYTIQPLMKIEAQFEGNTISAINDIVIHNGNPRHGIRYNLTVNDRPIGGTIIGDGIVVATPLGSTAYYRSITDSYFEAGIGIAFNNSTEQIDHVVCTEDKIITTTIVRGPAMVYADNQEKIFELKDGDKVVIKRSGSVGQRIVV
ncbi:MAG: NAD(+)/NADH kinase [Candidatus Pacebacteria bacterium]|nr:NAD(+)/NADH kinase [Candidatus Paceibacterota bacterium]